MMVKNDSLHYGLQVTAIPAEEPVSRAEAIEHLREDTDQAQGTLIDALITAARQWAEEYLRRALVTTEYTLTLDNFGLAWEQDPISFSTGCAQSTLYLPVADVQTVDAIRYIDTAGAQQTLATSNYRVDVSSLIARVTPAYGYTWPDLRPITNAVEVDFTAGYGGAEDVPEPIKAAIKFLVAHWYDNRHPVVVGSIAQSIPITVTRLLGPYRVRTF